jgi:Fic family protein
MASITLMEPLMPSEADRSLDNLAAELLASTHYLGGSLHPQVQETVKELVRSMNCYYSNLIEGHDTYPVDIDRALKKDFVQDAERRLLQLEAKAHIKVQNLIDEGQHPKPVVSQHFIRWTHREFYLDLPNELLLVKNPKTGEIKEVTPGEFRTGGVKVGHHIPPEATDILAYLNRFEEAYKQNSHSRIRNIIAAAASHHRLLWIHPFYDGNGRVARLFSHALLAEHLGNSNGLWSVARGFARQVDAYKTHLMAADAPRRGDLDGRGNLSAKELHQFCSFFLKTCLDQVAFMASALDIPNLLQRIEHYYNQLQINAQLPAGGFPLLREVLLHGTMERGKAEIVTGYKERQARIILKLLLEKRLLVSDTPKGVVRLGFPIETLEYFFPKLYPVGKTREG